MNKIKALRMQKSMTIRDLSEKSGVAIGYICALENDDKNDKTNPTREVMIKISEALNDSAANVFF